MTDEAAALCRPFHTVLEDWTDFDVAAFALGRALGLFPEGGFDAFRGVKHVLWSCHPVAEALHKMLCDLTAAGVLDSTESFDRFVLRSAYRDLPPEYVVAPRPRFDDSTLPIAQCHRRGDVRESVCALCGEGVWLPDEYDQGLGETRVWCRPCCFAQARARARALAGFEEAGTAV